MNYTENTTLNQNYSNILTTKLKINIRNLTEFPEEELVEITKEEYESLFIVRYFIKKISDANSRIYEVGVEQYNAFNQSPFYLTKAIKWKISGELNTPSDNMVGIKSEKGVIDHNTGVLNRLEKEFPGIKSKIPSVTQFYKK